MKVRQRLLPVAAAVLMASAAIAVSAPASAQSFSISIGNAPPPMHYEVVPPPRRGHVWVPGYWNWNGRQHVWVRGHWEVVRVGYYYDSPRWVQHGDRWHLNRGGWQRGNGPRGDRDRDGVPNRFDRDRDGDGVPNWHDRRPNDPRR